VVVVIHTQNSSKEFRFSYMDQVEYLKAKMHKILHF